MDYKKEMFETFHQKLPDATFVVMSGLLLPGRSKYTNMTQEINRQLEVMVENYDYMYFSDASDMTFDGKNYQKELFVEDEVHLNTKGQDQWKKEYIILTMEKVIREKGLESVKN